MHETDPAREAAAADSLNTAAPEPDDVVSSAAKLGESVDPSSMRLRLLYISAAACVLLVGIVVFLITHR